MSKAEICTIIFIAAVTGIIVNAILYSIGFFGKWKDFKDDEEERDTSHYREYSIYEEDEDDDRYE